MPAGAVYVGRPTKWGNPFVCKTKGDAAVLFRRWLMGKDTGKFEYRGAPDFRVPAAELRAAIDSLRGKDLACWCKPGEPCHADVLIELANAERRLGEPTPSKNPNHERDRP